LAWFVEPDGSGATISTLDGMVQARADIFARGLPGPGAYAVIYDDGFVSWSPQDPFERGYSRVDEPGEGSAAVAAEVSGEQAAKMESTHGTGSSSAAAGEEGARAPGRVEHQAGERSDAAQAGSDGPGDDTAQAGGNRPEGDASSHGNAGRPSQAVAPLPGVKPDGSTVDPTFYEVE